nr:Chain D, SER-LEU-ARG-PHE-LEU-TYR-GLU-GLY [Homo sapiens]6EOP_E Chain E, SER-LEU-ARG-PHE-LEU-TYR-GLU-GLY [Homo sapiens]6EOP_F Chain F, SER-LEU-ARG-PHE-LEU-TYR-GLU-GLY [Homo sapiens]6EOT_C Chain C, SER-LEU-ARG-PHE-LEU-TYR-GLU-GLY [Homo sapiens]6EOT_E Chain E, SER-LEU-ARG-PHE-LEU-TYR-GLU-GLY [Homo sapiens]6EOT_F Chain F, SER-LEU-ARG-PHE-LEU-TYR-GLU-GLY [Homo sapiens]6EOT_H Chain H, SER-LEU-ARG-PHE-LEU-TYR-GLU-GLY [Homo sapiens]6EOT_J Chain J, SER-LEU-ARG-PHE-LEU-TYR-GLU-GLY [Homo sapiens]6EO
SLRFLYEG